MTGKHCPKCATTKPADEFGRDKHRKDGIASKCKACDAAASRERYQAKAGSDYQTAEQRRQRVCCVGHCDQPHSAKGYCATHYGRMWRHGSPHVVNLGIHLSPQNGANNLFWKGRNVKYGSALSRVTRERGQARTHPCADCGKQASQWTYNGSDPEELTVGEDDNTALTGMRYSADARFYQPMCRSCRALLIDNRSR